MKRHGRGEWHYTFKGAGEVFSVVRPDMNKEMERRVREMVQEILEMEGCYHGR